MKLAAARGSAAQAAVAAFKKPGRPSAGVDVPRRPGVNTCKSPGRKRVSTVVPCEGRQLPEASASVGGAA